MSFASLRKVLRSARKGLCSTCSRTRYPQLEAAGAGHVGCLIYTFETLGKLISDDHNVTAMHVAARKGHISVLIYLIENKLVDGIPRAKNGATPAHDAAGTGNLECLRYLLSQTMASPNDIDSNNATPLHWAIQGGHLKVIQWLVIEGNAAIDTASKNGATPLHLAASKNYLDIVRWLTLYAYKHHPKPRRLVNSKDRNGATPIYHAAHRGYVNVIRWLAEKGGGDPTIFTAQGLAPIHAAAVGGHFEAIKYLFQFGSETAPGGLRTTEGASALHFAAAECHIKIIEWLLQQRQCTGNERDYYQSTPLHDAAERGHIKILEILCEYGVDITLTDVEGNTAREMAIKNGQTKAARYLGLLMKQRLPKGKTGNMTNSLERSRGISRTKHSKAEMIDNYRNAPPHQLPVNVFDDDLEAYDEVDGNEVNEGDEWTTLRDLIDIDEIQKMEELTRPPSQEQKLFTQAEEKRRKLEEDIRKEKEERIKKRRELLKKEEEYEKEIRKKILAEEVNHVSRVTQTPSEPTGETKRKSLLSPLKSGIPAKNVTIPPNSVSSPLSRDLVEKRMSSYEKKEPAPRGGKKILSRFWSSRKIGPTKTQSAQKALKTSQSWDSSMSSQRTPYEQGSDDDDGDDIDNSIPDPPPTPTVEYLLGKRAVNLRKRANPTLKEQIRERAANLAESKGESVRDSDDSDSHSSVGSSSKERKHHHKRGRHRRRRGSDGAEDGSGIKWNYNQLPVPQSSPTETRKILERKPTPFPSHQIPKSDIIEKKSSFAQQRLDFDAFDEMQQVLDEAISSPSSSLSPLNSPSSQSSPSSSLEASPLHTAQKSTNHLPPLPSAAPGGATTGKGKRGGPKLQPHLQNKQIAQQKIMNTTSPTNSHSQPAARTAPISRIANSRNKSRVTIQTQSPTGTAAPSSSRPQIIRQFGQTDSSTTASDPESDSTMDDIELQLNEIKTRLINSSAISMQNPARLRVPSPERKHTTMEGDSTSDDTDSSDTSSSDYTSTSDSDDSSSDDTSDDDMEMRKPISPKRPLAVKNVGASGNAPGRTGFNRARMLLRYPRLLRKKVVNLATIKEIAEEIVFDAETSQDRALIYHRIQDERKYMKAWRKYIQLMKSAYRKAEKMAQRKRKDSLAKAFYAWIQVRNMGTVAKDEEDRANLHYVKRLKKKTFRAWLYSKEGIVDSPTAKSLQRVDAEQKYLSWLNSQLKPSIGRTVDNISSSLSDGILIIQAVSYASGTKPFKYNTKPKVRLHRQDNWKTAHSYMNSVGINVKGIEPADLANGLEAAIHNLFNNTLKWYEKRTH